MRNRHTSDVIKEQVAQIKNANNYETANIDYEAWTEFISYYRYYIDEFAMDILGIKLFPYERLMLRGLNRGNQSIIIACRGIGKSWIVAVFFVCSAILYPNIKCGIASGTGQQAQNVIIQKLKGELLNNPAIAREFRLPISTSINNCVATTFNNSEIRAIVLAQGRGGDSARSWRFNYLLVDEARLVKDDIIETILIPMTKTKRYNALKWNQDEQGKVMFISSGYPKSSPFYSRFKNHVNGMVTGKGLMALALPYQIGVNARLFSEEDILQELEKPSMNQEKFDYEYNAMFTGSNGESYYPYELTSHCRVLEKPELRQPNKASVEYVITHDVAVSSAKNSDNACTHIIKLKPRPDGTYNKELVFTKVVNGMPLEQQRDYLRELIHLDFPNCIKFVIDGNGLGNGLVRLFYETWEYETNNGEIVEFPPLIADDDEAGFVLDNAVPLIRNVRANIDFNNTYYQYMHTCFENRTLKLLLNSEQVENDYKNGTLSPEKYAQYIEHDILQSELANIKQAFNSNDKITFMRILHSKKRDRATSLFYGLSVIDEMEQRNKQIIYANKKSNIDILQDYTFL